MAGKKALAGLKVVDLTTALSGPFGSMFFGDYGAEVIKVESLEGDQCRGWGPIDEETGESGFFASYNRNKKGVTLNLKSEKGLQMFYDLVKDADLLFENYRGGVTKRLKIDYETIRKINPSIIYVSGSGFGQTSPYAERACYDVVAQSMGGLVNLTGYKENDPVKVGTSVSDHVSGIYQAIGALVALYYRTQTGEGQLVDVSMIDSVFSILENAIPNYTMEGKITERTGNIDPSIAPFDIYKCKDGFCAIGVGNNRLWDKFCKIIGHEELLEDERYKTNDLRFKNYEPDLKATISEWVINYSKMELEELFNKEGIPCGPVLNMKEVINSPHIQARDMMVHCQHPKVGDVYMQGIVAKLSETPGSVDSPWPLLGEHNREVFNLTEEEEKELKEEGVI